MKYKKIKYFLSLIGLLILSKVGIGASKQSENALILEPNDTIPNVRGHYSHAAHSSHVSHYSCMLSSADSVGQLSNRQIRLILDSLNTENRVVLKTYLSTAVVEGHYTNKNSFNVKAIIIITREFLSSGHGFPCYEINVIAIPRDRSNRYYFDYSEYLKTIEECDSYIQSIGNEFRAIHSYSGGRNKKKPWMDKL